MKKVPNRKVKVKLNKIILQVLLLILILAALITQKDSILNILINKSKIKADIPADMKVGDIIKYDHKKGVDPSLLKTTIGKGTASTPGSGRYLYTSDPVQEQTFDASTINTTWHVWSIDRDKDEIMIVSDNVAPFKTYGAIDYIWYEHNMHKIASIFGHGKGTKKKEFTYKVGSQLEDTGDTATWKTGPGGIPKNGSESIPRITEDKLEKIEIPVSGARPLRTEDIEKAFGWTESTIKTDNKFTKNSSGYGVIKTNNIYFPQRDTGNSTQQWADKSIAKSAKQDVKGKDGWYWIDKTNVPANGYPENAYKNILWDWNGNNWFQLGQVGLDVYSSIVYFRIGMVFSGYFISANYGFVEAYADGSWGENAYTTAGRVAAFLSSSDIVYRKSVDNEGKEIKGKNQESIWEMEDEKELPKLPEGMKIGDIVNYDHTVTGVKIEDSRLVDFKENQELLKTTIEKGTASTPGSTYKQDFDGNKIDTKWRVWGVDEETGDVIILSDNVAPFKTYGAIDYIWYEHNMHQIASIFGHGKGTKKKVFTYKVGSQLEDTGDTATWKTGPGGIPKTGPEAIPDITEDRLEKIEVPMSGARPLRTEDIEKAFGWTESTIKTDNKFTKNSSGYGVIKTNNIYFPQRDTGNSTQQWADKNIAKAVKQDVKGKDGYYHINKSNVPENTYKNILWDWNGNNYFQLGQVGLDVTSYDVNFRRGMVYSDYFYSAIWDFASANADGGWYEIDYTNPGRVAAFLSSSDIVYRKSSTSGTHQEGIWDIELRSPVTKNITVNVKNKTGKDIKDGEVKIIAEGINTPVLETGKVSFTTTEEYTLNKSGIVMKDDKYKMYVEGLPEGTDYKILSHYEEESGKTHALEQDVLSFGNEDVTYDIVIYEDGKYIAPVTVTYIGGQKDKGFSTTVNLKLMDGNTECGSLKNKVLKRKDFEKEVEIDTETVEFNNVKLFDEETNELKKYTLKFEKTSSDNHKVETKDNKITVTYEPPQKEISVKTSLVLLDETTKIPVTLVAYKVDVNNTEIKLNNTEIELSNTNGYKYNKEHPVNIENGEAIKYKLDISKIDKSKYITSLEKTEYDTKIEFVLTIRPVLTLPMSGSDSMKVMGITLGLCTLAGFGLRAKNKFVVVFKKYDMMK